MDVFPEEYNDSYCYYIQDSFRDDWNSEPGQSWLKDFGPDYTRKCEFSQFKCFRK